uniref:Uncharacterized protein n=1 Tax=Oryza brachyantha TaxID=4533 RepID=J3MB33_ORYBR
MNYYQNYSVTRNFLLFPASLSAAYISLCISQTQKRLYRHEVIESKIMIMCLFNHFINVPCFLCTLILLFIFFQVDRVSLGNSRNANPTTLRLHTNVKCLYSGPSIMYLLSWREH